MNATQMQRLEDTLGIDEHDLRVIHRLSETEATGYVARQFINRQRERGLHAVADSLLAGLDSPGQNLHEMGAKVREVAASHATAAEGFMVLREAGVPTQGDRDTLFGDSSSGPDLTPAEALAAAGVPTRAQT